MNINAMIPNGHCIEKEYVIVSYLVQSSSSWFYAGTKTEQPAGNFVFGARKSIIPTEKNGYYSVFILLSHV